jgi:hypothetical protein
MGAFSYFGTEAFYGRSEISLCEVAAIVRVDADFDQPIAL